MPASFDLKGILSLAMQVMGLTYQAIRARAVKMFGEKAVQRLEKTSEIFKLLISGGPMAIWEHIKGKIGDLKEQILGQIKSFIISKVIQAGVTWVLSMLNPASAFIRACKAIYDIVMFFIERAAQIAELVNAVLDSIEAVASGAVGVMAAKIEAALARAIPVVISFLASVLGLGGISNKIRTIIEKVKAPIEKGIDWVLKKAAALLKKAGKWIGDKVGGKSKKGSDAAPGKAQEDLKKAGSGEDTEQSRAVKAKARAAMTQRTTQPLRDYNELQAITQQVLARLRPEGLKAINIRPKGGDKNRFSITAIASPEEEIDDATIIKSDDPRKKELENEAQAVRQRGGMIEAQISQVETCGTPEQLQKNTGESNPQAAEKKSADLMKRVQGARAKLQKVYQDLGGIPELLSLVSSEGDLKEVRQHITEYAKAMDEVKRLVYECLVDVAKHTTPAEYKKHARGKNDDQRRQSSEGSNPGQHKESNSDEKVKEMEREALLKGELVDKGGTTHAYHQFGEATGYAGGKDTTWLRTEITNMSGGGVPEVHSHPRAEKDVPPDIRRRKKT